MGYVIESVALILLFLMIVVPFEFQQFKLLLVMVIIFNVVLIAFLIDSGVASSKVVIWFLFVVSIGALFVLWGFLNGYSDSLKVMPVFVIWPIVYFFIMIAVRHPFSVHRVSYLLIASSIFISLYSIGYLLTVFSYIPDIALFGIIKSANYSIDSGFINYGIPAVTSMLYLMPFSLSAFLIWCKTDNFPIKRYWVGVSLLLGMIPLIFSGTRVFWILLFASPIITYILLLVVNCSNIRLKAYRRNCYDLFKYSAYFAALMAVMFYDVISDFFEFASGSEVFIDALLFSDKGTSVRVEQMKYLLDGWTNAPLFGEGHGASLATYRRTGNNEWAYEQTFFALLYQTGLIGVISYLFAILWIVFNIIKLSRLSERNLFFLVPITVGMLCFLIANLTNPYIYAFDHLWTIFLPVILINIYILEKLPICKDNNFTGY